ncbi:MAG: hypothetical protein AAFR67_16190, partial [Chloroflexota bacterium]
TEDMATPEATAEITPESTPEATPEPRPLTIFTGNIVLQGATDHSGITVQAILSDDEIVGIGVTDSDGQFTVNAPADEIFWLRAEKALYRTENVYVPLGVETVNLRLVGGDFNSDGCIGQSDIARLIQSFETNDAQTDINADGITDIGDLAILTGNFDADCETTIVPVESTPEATAPPEITPEVTQPADA